MDFTQLEVFSYLLWRTGDPDPPLANVLGLSGQVLPTAGAATRPEPARRQLRR